MKINDIVVIKKGHEGWNNDGMDKFIDRVVQITNIYFNYDDDILETDITRIRFHNDEGWNWVFEWGHYRKATSKEKLDYYTKNLRNIKNKK